MRTWIQRGGALVFGGALTVVVATRPAAGDEAAGASKYESSPALYGACELGLGGWPLYQSLFPNGWPTTKDYRKATLDAGEAAFVDNVAGILGSALGVPLSVSSGVRARVDSMKSDPKAPQSVSAYLKERLEVFRHDTGMAQPVDDKFIPVFLPFRRGEPIVNGFDETRPGTWAWGSKNTEATVAIDSVGFSIYAQTLLAEQELAADRKIDKGSGSETYIGRSDYSGFTAFCALDCAVAAMNELRDKLCLDLRVAAKPTLGPIIKNYSMTGESNRATFFPHIVIPKVQPASVQYEPQTGNEIGTSSLWDQAALLLGVCELARVSDGKTGAGRFFANDKKPSLDPDTSTKATDLALFIFETMYARHVNGEGRPSSFPTLTDYGKKLRIQDAGLLLLALESFLQLNAKTSTALANRQTHEAKGLLDRVAKFVVDVQKISKIQPGFNDSYTIQNGAEAATDNGAALATQGLAIRGLLAAKRAFQLPLFAGSAGARPDVLGAAQATLLYLEKSRWDGDRHAYVDTPGPREKAKITAIDAFAVLGGLRDLALDQKDVRYLLRYKSYLSTVRASGLQLSGSTRQNETDGVKKAAAVGLAPVLTSEITLP